MIPGPGLRQTVTVLWHFVQYLYRRIDHDRLTVTAGSMAYVTLLSLVPLITVVLSALSSFPVFASLGEQLQTFVFENFVPTAGDVVQNYLNEFVANAGKMTAVGIGALFVVAILLISSIDKSLNYIFRVRQPRRLVISFSIYWMVLTLGPILVGSSLAISSYLASLNIMGSETVSGFVRQLLRGLPVLMSTLAFLGLYLLVPNTKVRLRNALIGALIASALFELSKKGFALYITNFPSYQVIYGALAVVPILFVWVYLCWCIVLLGAEITASLCEEKHWRQAAVPDDAAETGQNRHLASVDKSADKSDNPPPEEKHSKR
ncbi:virulence factor BrkB family protein [Photobacterium sp. GJ3]|uniref:virulence factor BrkB family protein n=1 Tax=Photobacterium sp. GJ3 TaxID=2829502 RepID=UPI001B8BC0E9|nr:virulence factor BrkB family protein [Photobacterium sp. GJ3]QUJ69211.1 virulence factor BrkB family protein [Photobacterium sp. GJ3]